MAEGASVEHQRAGTNIIVREVGRQSGAGG